MSNRTTSNCTMSEVDKIFSSLRSRGEKALMPFIAAGDPNLETTEWLLNSFADAGCQLCELGIPYSDPIADGPTIQAAFVRALRGGIKLDDLFASQARLKNRICRIAMLSYAIVFRKGIEGFVKQARSAGFAGLIVPDLPIEESELLNQMCQANEMSLIQLITPTTSVDRAKRIIQVASGFIYYVSVMGVTGQKTVSPFEIQDNLGRLRTLTDLPICIGFGIQTADQVREFAPHCDGVIVGSALVRRIEEGVRRNLPGRQIALEIGDYCRELMAALQGS